MCGMTISLGCIEKIPKSEAEVYNIIEVSFELLCQHWSCETGGCVGFIYLV